jgi:hypothetical protein
MLTNELLETKYRAQRALAEQSGDDLQAYAQHVHRIVRDVERKHGLKFRYWPGKKAASSPDKVAKSGDRGTATRA